MSSMKEKMHTGIPIKNSNADISRIATPAPFFIRLSLHPRRKHHTLIIPVGAGKDKRLCKNRISIQTGSD